MVKKPHEEDIETKDKKVCREDELIGSSSLISAINKNAKREYPLTTSSISFEENNNRQYTDMLVKTRCNLQRGEMVPSNESLILTYPEKSSIQRKEVSQNSIVSDTATISIPLVRNKDRTVKKSKIGRKNKKPNVDETFSLISEDESEDYLDKQRSGKGSSEIDMEEGIYLVGRFRHLSRVAFALDKALNAHVRKKQAATFESIQKSILISSQMYSI